ncbi:hypothetical protein [Pusillimonas sp. T2]|nr:hypothetical protein [Pusillimonas sp. T2]
MANDKPKFSAGLVTVIITLVFVALFGFFVMEGAAGINQHAALVQGN